MSLVRRNKKFMEKNLKEKAIDIKGKKYVLVSDRIIYFNETYKEGCIITELLSPVESEHIVVKATVYPEGLNGRKFTGHSQATIGDGYINKTSALENAETSSVGRALALTGIGVIDSVASVDEINKATGSQGKTKSGSFCSACGSEGIISAKTGKPYCPNWQKHKLEKVAYNLKTKEETEQEEVIQLQNKEDFESGKAPF